MPESNKAGHGILKKIIMALSVVITFLGAVELTCRINYKPKKIRYKGVHEHDPDKGYRMKKNFNGFFGGKALHTNSMGYRDEEFRLHKSNNEIRILAIGDSISFGQAVEHEETFTEVLQRRLNNRFPGKKFEVMNAGTSGYSPIQEIVDLKRCLKFKPDTLIIQTVINDVIDPYIYFHRFGAKRKPWHGVEDLTFFQFFMTQHSATYLFIKDMIRQIEFRKEIGGKLTEKAKHRDIYRARNLVFHPEMAEIIQAWRLYKYWLQEIINLARENNMDIILLASPYEFQLRLISDMALPQQNLYRFSKINDITYLDLLERLRAELIFESGIESIDDYFQNPDDVFCDLMKQAPYLEKQFWEKYFVDYDHYSVSGHRFVAEMLYQSLLPILAHRNLIPNE